MQRIDWVDPERLFLAGPARESHAFWLDAGPDATEGVSWLGVGVPAGRPPDECVLAAGSASTSTVPGGFMGGWIGWIGYDDAAALAGVPAAHDTAAPAQAGLVVESFIVFDHDVRAAWLVAPADEWPAAVAQLDRWRARLATQPLTPVPPAALRPATPRHSPGEYAELVERCRAAIRVGDAYQLCLTTRFALRGDAAEPVDPVVAYRRLRRAQPAHHGGYIRVGDHALLSASPERFLQVAGGIVRTRPIKGTRPRGVESAVDEALARELLDSEKERAENVMIVDLMRNDLQRVCEPGTVAAEQLLVVESYAAVHQLVSTVAGRLRPGVTLGALLTAAFPAGSMTGAPKLSAMTILQRLEGGPRGVYAGCFGWIGADGALDLAMTIRSIVVHADGAYVGAGGGITWLSDPAAEVAEVAIKAKGPLAALGAALPDAWQRAEGDQGVVR